MPDLSFIFKVKGRLTQPYLPDFGTQYGAAGGGMRLPASLLSEVTDIAIYTPKSGSFAKTVRLDVLHLWDRHEMVLTETEYHRYRSGRRLRRLERTVAVTAEASGRILGVEQVVDRLREEYFKKFYAEPSVPLEQFVRGAYATDSCLGEQ